MKIKLLSEQLASQIAAGEVVERPASVVKELVENALDAGATTINIDIAEGGRGLIQVADNGAGIDAEEVETAFLRHATSKLSSVDDLFSIPTLGFRGEALAAIASVSHVTLITRPASQRAGIRLALVGGIVASREEIGAPQGTVIAVQNLFYNTPARLKFLKSAQTERQAIDDLITRYALAYPHIRWRLIHDGRITFQAGGTGQIRDVLISVYGLEITQQLIEIGNEREAGSDESPIMVQGFVSPPALHRANRTQITFFVNGRWVKDQQLTFALIEAYHTFLPTGRFPIGLIFITIPFEEVDVNVHPTKAEVRFRQPRAVFGAVQRAVRGPLVTEPQVKGEEGPPRPFEQLTTPTPWYQKPPREEGKAWEEQPELTIPAENGSAGGEKFPVGGQRLPIMRVMGQIRYAYLIAEGPEGLYLIDQHAAHERILYEQLLAQWKRQGIAMQPLVTGLSIHLTPSQTGLLMQHLPILETLGFSIESLGPQLFMIRAVPALLIKSDPANALRIIVEDLEREAIPMQAKLEEMVLKRVCKAFAIKAGQPLAGAEMDALVRQLEQCEVPMTCPHGRPTMIHLSVNQLAREFGRT